MTDKRAPQRALLPLWAAVLSAGLAAVMMDLAYPEAAVWILAFPATALVLVSLIGRRFGERCWSESSTGSCSSDFSSPGRRATWARSRGPLSVSSREF